MERGYMGSAVKSTLNGVPIVWRDMGNILQNLFTHGKRPFLTCFAVLMPVILMLGCAGTPPPPYPPSELVTGLSFKWFTHRQLAPGSDNWAITWADDDNQYTTFGDGGGFGGTNREGRVSLGFARVEGPRESYQGFNIWGGANAENPARFEGKSRGVVSIDSTMYMWRCGSGSESAAFDFQQLYLSTDHSATWESAGIEITRDSFPASEGFFCPTFLQFGKDYDGARDDFVYMYAPEIKTDRWDVQRPGEITLMRSPKAELIDFGSYEYFAGTREDGTPNWTSDIGSRKPVFEDADNGVMRTSVNYNSGLGRYFLITEHTKRSGSSGGGNIGIYEASEPWGPWRTVFFEPGWAPHLLGKGSFFWLFSNKWASDDGRRFVMIFNTNDQWNSVEGDLIIDSSAR